jgi:hypothetical protein
VTDRKATAPRIPARTPAILKDPVRNRGVAFSVEERAALGPHWPAAFGGADA